MKTKEVLKLGFLVVLLFLFLVVGLLFRRASPVNIHMTQCECDKSANQYFHVQKPNLAVHTPSSDSDRGSVLKRRYLSYQPPGNGWNNQRIALENALVLAKLLNRTLVVHPLAPHELGSKLKLGNHYGYVAYNMLNETDLLPLSDFLDLDLLSQVVPVVEFTHEHTQFVRKYSHLSWRNVCHSPGYGFWVDQPPQSSEEVELLTKQTFTSLGRVWRERCPEEVDRVERTSIPIVKFVSDLSDNPAEMLYFEQGTLFGIHIRFIAYEDALEAQHWVVDYVRYSQTIWKRVYPVIQHLGGKNGFNAIQVRRKMHMDSKLQQSYWIERMIDRNFSKLLPVYVATNDPDLKWFEPFVREGFKLYFSTNFTEILGFKNIKESLRKDILGIHEQCLCEEALHFIPSPASTFNAFILRHRGEVNTKARLIQDTLHTYWVGHQLQKPL